MSEKSVKRYFKSSPPATYLPRRSQRSLENPLAGGEITCIMSSRNPTAPAAKSVAKGSQVCPLLRKLNFSSHQICVEVRAKNRSATTGGATQMSTPPNRGLLISPSPWNFWKKGTSPPPRASVRTVFRQSRCLYRTCIKKGVTQNASKKLVAARVAIFKTLKVKLISIGMIAKSTAKAGASLRILHPIPRLRL